MPLETTQSHSEAMAAMKRALSKLETAEGRLAGLRFQPRPTDVFVVTTPKAGTTWVQQIVHALRGGSMDFDEVFRVMPFVEMAHDVGIELDAEQVANPRVFKTHAWQPDCPKGARYILCLRHPVDVAVSFYHFFEGWFFEPGSIGADEFVADFVLARGRPASSEENASYWDHLLSWWPRRHEANVCLLFYEDLQADLPGQVRRIAEFLGGAALEESRIALAEERSSFAYMKAHEGQFNEGVLKRARNAACGLAPDAGLAVSKVRRGQVGGNGMSLLSPATREALLARWGQVAAATGFSSYEELRAGFARERQAAASGAA